MLTRPAEPNITQVLEEFRAEQSARLAPSTLKKYADVLELLQSYLNGYAYESLSAEESALFDRHFNAKGKEHREFCELFGPDKVVENLGMFLGYFMIRKVMAGEDFKRTAGTVSRKLSKWLAARGYLSEETGREAAAIGAAAARDLPRAERAARFLRDQVDRQGFDPSRIADKDYLEFDHFTIARMEPAKLWLEIQDGRKLRSFGPIPVPASVAKLLREGWEVGCALGRIRGTWRIVEIGNVYPD